MIKKVQEELKCVGYVRTSSLLGDGVKLVFDKLIQNWYLSQFNLKGKV